MAESSSSDGKGSGKGSGKDSGKGSGKGASIGERVGGCAGGCGELLLVTVLFGAVVITWAMHSNTGAATSITGGAAGKTAEGFMHERIIGSAIIAIAGAVIGALLSFPISRTLGLGDSLDGARPSNAAELIANGFSNEPMASAAGRGRSGSVAGVVVCAIVCMMIGSGYGAVATVANAESLAAGPKTVQVGRPEVSTKYHSGDEDSDDWYDCFLTFTVTDGADAGRKMTFDVGECVGNNNEPDSTVRLVHDLAGVNGDKLKLEYYDAFRWPVYVGVKSADPAYS